jgi:hypothetical protein
MEIFDFGDDFDLEARRADQKQRLAEYAERLEAEKSERGDSGKRRRSDLEEKSIELLVEGAVGIIAEGRLEAEVVGDTGTHRVSWSEADGWWCDCPGSMFRRRCSHQLAVRRVVKLTTTEEKA